MKVRKFPNYRVSFRYLHHPVVYLSFQRILNVFKLIFRFASPGVKDYLICEGGFAPVTEIVVSKVELDAIFQADIAKKTGLSKF